MAGPRVPYQDLDTVRSAEFQNMPYVYPTPDPVKQKDHRNQHGGGVVRFVRDANPLRIEPAHCVGTHARFVSARLHDLGELPGRQSGGAGREVYRRNQRGDPLGLRILEGYLPEHYPRIDQMAEIVGISVRTLQRRLSERGLSYSAVVSRARFEIASHMLTRTDAPMIEIAFATAYSDPSHFARAFRRFAGVSPGEYRGQTRRRSAE